MKNILLKDGETYLVCLEFMNKKSFSSYPFELDIIEMHPVFILQINIVYIRLLMM